MTPREELAELVRHHANKWRLGWSIKNVAYNDNIEVRFGKSMPPGFDPSNPSAESYFVAVYLDPREPLDWGRDVHAAVESMVRSVVLFLKPYPALEQPE